MADATVRLPKEIVDPLKADVAAAQAEIAALKARPLQKWAGTHVAGVPYGEASLVTRQGSLCVATAATTTTPGDPGSDWRLIVKRVAVTRVRVLNQLSALVTAARDIVH